MSTYKTTVGIEVHAELKTKSKMFCGCSNNPHDVTPNANVCPVCMAHPGSLPVVNKEAIVKILQVGKAVGGTLANFSEFDRKNYFYPDIPKAYQISQYEFPFVTGGELAGVAITRIHLEEDTARSLHDQGQESLVDFNRAGVPLLELVTEPVIGSAKQAGIFARELQLLLRTLGVSEANMEKGEMRVEANISISPTDTFGTKVEVKNLNSFRSVENAIEYEIKRQTGLLEKGDFVVQETRGWNEVKNITFSQRKKETANDYRYFPDPDIPKFKLSEVPEFENSRIGDISHDTPQNRRIYLNNFGLSENQIEIIISENVVYSFFSTAVQSIKNESSISKLIANYLLTDVTAGKSLTEETKLFPVAFARLMELLATSKINSRIAKDLIAEVVFEGKDPDELVKSRNLSQNDSEDDLLPIIKLVLSENISVVDEYKAGKVAVLQFLLGQCMKKTKGSANPATLKKLLESTIASQ